MDESKIQENIGSDGNNDQVFCDLDKFLRFNCRKNVTLEGLFDLVKFYVLEFLIHGADKVFKDRKSKKKLSLANGLQASGESTSQDQRNKINFIMLENEKMYTKSYYPLPQPSEEDRLSGRRKWNKEFDGGDLEVEKSPSGSCSEFPFNFLASLAKLVMKSMGFQFNLLVSFFTFPIWLTYFSLTFLMFPIQTSSHIQMYLMRKMLRMWNASWVSVTSFIGERINIQSSMVKLATRFCRTFLWSIYVCFMLLGLLVLGFVIGGFVMQHLVEEPIQKTDSLNFDFTKASPVAFVPIMSSPVVGVPSGLISKDNVEAGRQIDTRVIPYNHKLQLTVSLTLPESEYNRKLGIFQVRVEFLSANGKVTAASSHPSMLRYKSQPIRFAETLLKSAPLIASFQSESQILNIKMSKFTEGLEPTACLKVILEERAEYQPGTGIPEIYATSLALESELPQLKRIIWNWRRTIFVWTSIMSFLTELVFILLFCRPIILPRGKPKIACAKKDPHLNNNSWFKFS